MSLPRLPAPTGRTLRERAGPGGVSGWRLRPGYGYLCHRMQARPTPLLIEYNMYAKFFPVKGRGLSRPWWRCSKRSAASATGNVGGPRGWGAGRSKGSDAHEPVHAVEQA
jgi:hypothetical protein